MSRACLACPPAGQGLASIVSFHSAHHTLVEGQCTKETQEPRLLNPACLNGGKSLLPGSPRSCTPRGPGGVLFLFQVQLWEGSCSVGISGRAADCRAGGDDSYPTMFPLKIPLCRQLSDVCDGNTWLQQQHMPLLKQSWPSSRDDGVLLLVSMPCPLKNGPDGLQVLPPVRGWPLFTVTWENHVCPSFAMLFLELSDGADGDSSSFPCVPPR